MKNLCAPELQRYRVQHPMERVIGTAPDWMRPWVGAYLVPYGNKIRGLYPHECCRLKVIASRGGGPSELYGPGGNWDHVSVSVNQSDRCPTWPQMSFIKELFFGRHEVAMQLHPVDEYINNHPGCLHLWRPLDVDIPLPPSVLVGLQELNVA